MPNSSNQHWHFLYRHRRESLASTTRQIIAGQIFTVIVSIGAGLILDNLKLSIAAVSGAFLLMPGIVDLSASITGALGAKLNHFLDKKPKQPTRLALRVIGYSLLVGCLAATIVGLFAFIIGNIFLNVGLWDMLILSLVSTLAVGLVVYPFVSALVFFIKGRGWNPDNLVGPIQSSIVDVLAVLAIAVVSGWLV